MPILTEECKARSATATVFGGGALRDNVRDLCKEPLTGSLKPDMFGQPVRDRFVDGVTIKSWSVKPAIR